MALRWIKQNIGAFGGDASKVVLWGQSAGAVAVGYHMMIRHSGDQLFRRAILESGNPLLPLALAKSSYRQQEFIEFASRLNCTVTNSQNGQSTDVTSKWIDQNWANKVLPCLRNQTTAKLFDEYRKFAEHSPLAFMPNIEDRSLFAFDSIWKAIREGSFSFSGQILIGTNEAEGAQYVKVGPLEPYYSHDKISPNFTRSNVLRTLSDIAPESLRSMLEPVLDMLMDGIEDANNSTQLWHRYVQLVGDMVFVCPDYFFVNGYTKRPKKNWPTAKQKQPPSVYYYRFKSLVSRPFDCPRWSLGACHTDELQFVFGNPILLKSLYPPEEQKLAHSIMATWLQFAHHG